MPVAIFISIFLVVSPFLTWVGHTTHDVSGIVKINCYRSTFSGKNSHLWVNVLITVFVSWARAKPAVFSLYEPNMDGLHNGNKEWLFVWLGRIEGRYDITRHWPIKEKNCHLLYEMILSVKNSQTLEYDGKDLWDWLHPTIPSVSPSGEVLR